MRGRTAFVGRGSERERLHEALERARGGAGSLVLVSGEAGIGKSRLALELADDDVLVIAGAGVRSGSSPYGPLTAALRAYLRTAPRGLSRCGPLAPHLALLLPELGPPPAVSDRESLLEAVRCALVEIASNGPAVVILDD